MAAPPPAPPTVDLVSSDGTVAPFKRADVERLKTRGWKLATPENVARIKEAGSITGGLKAFGEGGARGLTAGLSDVAEVKLGISTPEEILARQEANPALAMTGQLAGGIGLGAGIVATGGALGLGGAALGITAGAVTGALEGGGNEISQQLLSDAPMRGEEVANHALQGALLGGVTAGALEGAGVVVGKVARGIKGTATEFSAKAAKTAEGQALRDLSPTGKKLQRLADEGNLEAVTAKVQAEAGTPIAERLQNNRAAKDAIGKKIGAALESDTAPLVDTARVDEIHDMLRQTAAPGEFETKLPTWKKKVHLLADKVNDIRSADLPANKLHAIRQELDSIIHHTPGGVVGKAPRELYEARTAITKHLEDAMGPEFQQLSKDYALHAETGKLYEKAAGAALRGGPGAPSFDPHTSPELAFATGHPYAAAGLAAKNYFSSARVQRQVADKLSSSQFLTSLAQQNAEGWAKSISGLVGGVSAAAAPGPTVHDYEDLSTKVLAANDSPVTTAGHISTMLGGELHANHPETADRATTTAQNAIRYLADQLPKSQLTPSLLEPQYQPGPVEKAQWLEAYRAVMHPESVYSHPTEAALAALQAVYPKTFAVTQKRLLVALQGKQMPYQAQLRLSKVLGPAVSSLTNPQFVHGMQEALKPTQEEGNQDGQKGSARQAGATRAKKRVLNFKNTAKDSQTTIDRIMGK